VRVNAQLIDARTDGHLWAQTYDRTSPTCLRSKARWPRTSLPN